MSLYVPPHFRATDPDQALRLMDEHPFAMLISQDGTGEPFVSHLPLLAERSADNTVRLTGHMSRHNDQWRHFQTHPSALAVFRGPHAYVSPTWYQTHDVPTWNYVVVHVRGPVRLVEDHRALVRLLARMSERFEGTAEGAWRFGLPDDLRSPADLTAAIVGFELQAETVDTKLKLSQNRSDADRRGVERGLLARGGEAASQVLEWMRRLRAPGR